MRNANWKTALGMYVVCFLLFYLPLLLVGAEISTRTHDYARLLGMTIGLWGISGILIFPSRKGKEKDKLPSLWKPWLVVIIIGYILVVMGNKEAFMEGLQRGIPGG